MVRIAVTNFLLHISFEALVCENRCFSFTELLTGWDRKTLPHHKIYTMTETKVYKLNDSIHVEAFTTSLGIEGIKHKVFEYEEYTAIEVTGTPLEIISASTIYQQATALKL